MFRNARTSSLAAGLGAAVGLALASGSAIAEYPERPVTYVNPFSPGGECDIAMRMIQPKLEERLGVDVPIEYHEGGGGSVGWAHVADQAPDGYTIACFSIPHIIAQPLARDPGYETDELELIYTYQSNPQVLVVRDDSPYETLEDFVADAQDNPGSITVGGTGTASGNHLGAVRLMQTAEIELTWIPFPGTGPTIPALEGGHVGALMTNSTVAHQNKDKFRALAVASEERLPFMEDVPTFRELGYDFQEAIHRGVLAPAGFPEEAKQLLAEHLDEITQELTPRMEEMGHFVEYLGPEESAELVERLQPEYRQLLEDIGLRK